MPVTGRCTTLALAPYLPTLLVTHESSGDHSSIYMFGFGVVHRHDIVRNVFARKVFRLAAVYLSVERNQKFQRPEREPGGGAGG